MAKIKHEHGVPQTLQGETFYAFYEHPNPTMETNDDLARATIHRLQRTAMSSNLPDRFRASNYWIEHPIFVDKCEIIVVENETKRYTLVPDRSLLEHEEDGNPGCDFFTITWTRGSDPDETTPIFQYAGDGADDSRVPVITAPDGPHVQVFSMRSEALQPPLPCVFVALGWLREKDMGAEERMQTTYYVVLLNLSTNPVSVWLLFDYHLEEDDGFPLRWTNRLGNYHNRGWVREFQEGKLLPKLDDHFPAPTGDINRVRQFLTQHSNLKAPFDHPNELGAKPMPQANGFHKRDPNASFSQGSTLVGDTDDHVPVRADKLGKDATGYFGLPRHDLALLAPDINSWSSQGFPAEQVITCLRGSHVHLGSTLRAQTATDEQVGSIQQSRVSFQHLVLDP
ncbi:MAG: hypothetical protein Q9184_006236 [Pyrenodesmia sp. 2 TL-2023]